MAENRQKMDGKTHKNQPENHAPDAQFLRHFSGVARNPHITLF